MTYLRGKFILQATDFKFLNSSLMSGSSFAFSVLSVVGLEPEEEDGVARVGLEEGHSDGDLEAGHPVGDEGCQVGHGRLSGC